MSQSVKAKSSNGMLVGKDESGKYNGDHGWSASHDDDGSSASAPLLLNGEVVALVVSHHKSLWVDPSKKMDANARRLVACWNACDGISTETLEASFDAGGGGRQFSMKTYDPNIRWAMHTVEITYQMWEYTLTAVVTVTGNCRGKSILETAIGIHADEIYEQQGDNVELALSGPGKEDGDKDELLTSPEDDDIESWLESMCVGLKIVSHTVDPTKGGEA
jgi:hypothetical protein